MSVFTASDWMSSGTSSVPMLPEADVMKTLDMLVNLCSDKTGFVYSRMKVRALIQMVLVLGSEPKIRSNSEESWKIYSSSYNRGISYQLHIKNSPVYHHLRELLPWSSIEDIGSGPGQNQVLSKTYMH